MNIRAHVKGLIRYVDDGKGYRDFLKSLSGIDKHRYIIVLGAQLSSRCLSIDGSSSKCWSISTYPKRHEPSLDIW